MACPPSGYHAEIGEHKFSRVRQVDDEARKKRIFDAYAYCSLDVNGLNKQLEQKEWTRKNEEDEAKAYAEYQDMKNRNMKFYEDQIALRRKENGLEAARDWAYQHQDRVAQETAEKTWRMQINERFGPFTRDRYLQQDLERAREHAIFDKLQEGWCDQLCNKEEQKKRDDRESHDFQQLQCEARKNMRERSEWIGRRVFEDNRELMNEQMDEASHNVEKRREIKHENHMYQIQPEYFAQFQTRSR
ncbi:unnamed protein product [Calypogeia fissa]